MKQWGMYITGGLVGLGLIGVMAVLVFAVDKALRVAGLIGGH